MHPYGNSLGGVAAGAARSYHDPKSTVDYSDGAALPSLLALNERMSQTLAGLNAQVNRVENMVVRLRGPWPTPGETVNKAEPRPLDASAIGVLFDTHEAVTRELLRLQDLAEWLDRVA